MFINIDFRDKRPLYEQVSDKLEELILKGVIKPEEALPSVRALAVELSINPNTVQKAYAALEKKGLVYSVSGRGSFASDASAVLPKKREELFGELDAILFRAKDLGITKNDIIARIEGIYI